MAYTKSPDQCIILDRQGKEHKVTNPMFLENEPGFIATEKGDRDFDNDHEYQQLISAIDEGNVGQGAPIVQQQTVDTEQPDEEGVHQEEQGSHDDPSHDNDYEEQADVQPDPSRGNETRESSILHRSDRVRRPTQALVESRETTMSRQERRREERKKGNGIV